MPLAASPTHVTFHEPPLQLCLPCIELPPIVCSPLKGLRSASGTVDNEPVDVESLRSTRTYPNNLQNLVVLITCQFTAKPSCVVAPLNLPQQVSVAFIGDGLIFTGQPAQDTRRQESNVGGLSSLNLVRHEMRRQTCPPQNPLWRSSPPH